MNLASKQRHDTHATGDSIFATTSSFKPKLKLYPKVPQFKRLKAYINFGFNKLVHDTCYTAV